MVKKSEFERGDIVLVGFDPASGHEQQGAGRPALVLSVQAFNQLGMTLVAPITQGGNFARYAGFSVPLHCEEGDVHGVVLVNQVRMIRQGENQVRAVDDISFTVEKGEFLAIIGPSGSGKSTLLHILGGVDCPTSGKVFVDGQDVYAQNEDQLAIFRRRQVGLIYQFYNLIPVLNVVENMTLPVLMDGRQVNQERLEELLDVLGLRGREKYLPNQLSGGQQQRVSIGRALMNAPAVVLADEPTGNLDSKNSQTLVIITHDENIALQAHRVIAIEDGRITRDERIREVLE